MDLIRVKDRQKVYMTDMIEANDLSDEKPMKRDI